LSGSTWEETGRKRPTCSVGNGKRTLFHPVFIFHFLSLITNKLPRDPLRRLSKEFVNYKKITSSWWVCMQLWNRRTNEVSPRLLIAVLHSATCTVCPAQKEISWQIKTI
jgi:hypothetical protein